MMIVRVQGAGQYRLPGEAISSLNALDSELLQAIRAKNEQAMTAVLTSMTSLVQQEGRPLGHDEIVPSDMILPPSTLSYEEIVSLLQEDGLVPG